MHKQIVKDSHTGYVPSSSDQLARYKKVRSQCTRSGQKSGGHAGHDGYPLALSASPDKTIVYLVESGRIFERRQVVDVPPAWLRIPEPRAEGRCLPVFSIQDAHIIVCQSQCSLRALAVSLTTHHLLLCTRTVEVLSDQHGARMREGTILPLRTFCLQSSKQQLTTSWRTQLDACDLHPAVEA